MKTLSLLAAVLLTLKLTGHLHLGWLGVLSPVWLPLAIFTAAAVMIALALGCFCAAVALTGLCDSLARRSSRES